MENTQTARIINRFKSLNLSEGKIYILGNRIELYYLLDKLPPVWNTLIMKIGNDYYLDVESRTIREIKRGKVMYIVIPKPIDANFVPLVDLTTYISKFYTPLYEDKDVQIL